MKKLPNLAAALACALLAQAGGAVGQGIQPVQMKPILAATRASWIAFRNYDGKQWVYFTHLLTYHCGLKAIHYGVNGAAPETGFPVPACKAERPLGVDPARDKIYFTAPLDAVRALTVVVTFADGSRSAPATFVPCAAGGDTTCAKLQP